MTKNTLFSLIIGLSLTCPLITIAAEAEHAIDRKMNTCLKKDYSTVGMKNCTQQAIDDWDAELNRVYKALRSKLNAKAKQSLKNSQSLWINYRDAEWIAIEAIYGNIYENQAGGTMWGVLAISAKLEIVKDRVLELTSYLAAFEAN